MSAAGVEGSAGVEGAAGAGGAPGVEGAAGVEGTPRARLSRRQLLFGGGAGLAAGLVIGGAGALGLSGARVGGLGLSGVGPDAEAAGREAVAGQPVSPFGAHQAGVARPTTPQRNCAIAVLNVPALREPSTARAQLAAISAAVASLTDPALADAWVLPDGVGDLTVLIGVGPDVVGPLSVAAERSGAASFPLEGAEALPSFAGDDVLPASLRGGDLLIIASSSDAAPLSDVLAYLIAAVSGADSEATTNWVQHGVRGAGSGTIARNPLGYLDGIIVPEGTAELDENVWIADGPAAGGTVCVLRRLRIDTAAFADLAPAEQDAAVGRHRTDGSPLSGGGMRDEADVMAKTPEGEFLTPLGSHVRAAHPSFTGAGLMLRRSYGFADGAQPGMTFISYQAELATFAKTQHRLDENDDMMKFATPTATGSFLVLPGVTAGSTLGEPILRSAGV